MIGFGDLELQKSFDFTIVWLAIILANAFKYQCGQFDVK